MQAIASRPFSHPGSSAPVQEQNATVDTSNVSMEATNSFGKLLLDGMDLDGENGSNFSSGNRVIGITMNGSTATVKYVAEEDADLVVGIYTDDSEEQMVASDTVAVEATPENTGYSTVDVEVTGSIPAYYVVKAYLLDKTEHAPLSNAYTDRSATKVIVDLESATINDFPEEQVVNLDDKSTTNFIVVNDNVTLLKADEVTVGKNQVVEIDNENLTYVIGNATEKIKSLQIGDVLTYEYEPGYFLIARVADISVDGDMVRFMVITRLKKAMFLKQSKLRPMQAEMILFAMTVHWTKAFNMLGWKPWMRTTRKLWKKRTTSKIELVISLSCWVKKVRSTVR